MEKNIIMRITLFLFSDENLPLYFIACSCYEKKDEKNQQIKKRKICESKSYTRSK